MARAPPRASPTNVIARASVIERALAIFLMRRSMSAGLSVRFFGAPSAIRDTIRRSSFVPWLSEGVYRSPPLGTSSVSSPPPTWSTEASSYRRQRGLRVRQTRFRAGAHLRKDNPLVAEILRRHLARWFLRYLRNRDVSSRSSYGTMSMRLSCNDSQTRR